MIGQYINELLYQFNTVTIPGFGTIKKTSEATSVHPVETVFGPPEVKLQFDKLQQHNDGVLANYIAEKEKIPFFEALSKIRVFVESIQQALTLEKVFNLSQIGEFSMNGNELIFTQQQGLSTEIEFFGLPPVQAKPIIRSRKTETKPIVQKKKKSPVWMIIISIFALIILSGVFVIFVLKPHKTPKYSSYFESVPLLNEQKYSLAQNTFNKTAFVTELSKNYLRISYNDTVPKKETVINTNTQTQTQVSVSTDLGGNYLIIAGSFKLKENADNYVAKLKSKGYNPEIIQASNGMYMVSYNRFSDLGSANTSLEKIKTDENPAAWVLKY